MKLALLTFACALLCPPAFAADAEVPEDLQEADYITAVDVEAEVPYGELFIDDAVIAIFPRLEDRLSGMLIGRARLRLRPPHASAGTPKATTLKVARAYLATSPHAEIKIAPKGRALAARRWDGLSSDEQAQFLEVYNAGLADTWLDDNAGVRDPTGKEFFTAFWVEQARGKDASRKPPPDVRYDFKVSADGSEVSFSDRSSGMVLFQLPAATATAPQPDTSP